MKKTDRYLAPFLLYMCTFAFCVGLVTVPSCGGIDCKDPKNASNLKCIPADVISCAAAEEQAVTAGKDILAIGLDIAGKIATAYETAKAAGQDTTAAIEAAAISLFATYGEPIVACVMKDQVPVAAPSTGSGSAAAAVPDPFASGIEAFFQKKGIKFAPSPSGSGGK